MENWTSLTTPGVFSTSSGNAHRFGIGLNYKLQVEGSVALFISQIIKCAHPK
jgi:hypothetical protein